MDECLHVHAAAESTAALLRASKRNRSHRHTRGSGFPAPEHTTTRQFNKQQLGGDFLLHLPVIVIRDLLSMTYSAVPCRGSALQRKPPPPRTSSSIGELLRPLCTSICSNSLVPSPTVTISSATKTRDTCEKDDPPDKRSTKITRQTTKVEQKLSIQIAGFL